jgi:hypothetical protein
MKFFRLLLILFLFVKKAPAQDRNVFQSDFKILYECLSEDHPLRNYHIDSISLKHRYDSLNALININTSKQTFLVYCESLINVMHCKHTIVYDPTKIVKLPEPASVYSYKVQQGIGYLKMSDFDGGKTTMRTFFRAIEKNKIDTIIIDLKNNPGGNGNIGNYLLKYVIDTSYTHYLICNTELSKNEQFFERRTGLLISNQYKIKGKKKWYYFTVKPKKKNHFDGKIYLLINEQTLSTATYVSSYLKHKCKAEVIGLETGENEYMLGGGVIRTLNLPSSGLNVKFPLYAWIYGSLENYSPNGLKPHYRHFSQPKLRVFEN